MNVLAVKFASHNQKASKILNNSMNLKKFGNVTKSFSSKPKPTSKPKSKGGKKKAKAKATTNKQGNKPASIKKNSYSLLKTPRYWLAHLQR
jgi:hypothetical protein